MFRCITPLLFQSKSLGIEIPGFSGARWYGYPHNLRGNSESGVWRPEFPRTGGENESRHKRIADQYGPTKLEDGPELPTGNHQCRIVDVGAIEETATTEGRQPEESETYHRAPSTESTTRKTKSWTRLSPYPLAYSFYRTSSSSNTFSNSLYSTFSTVSNISSSSLSSTFR